MNYLILVILHLSLLINLLAVTWTVVVRFSEFYTNSHTRTKNSKNVIIQVSKSSLKCLNNNVKGALKCIDFVQINSVIPKIKVCATSTRQMHRTPP